MCHVVVCEIDVPVHGNASGHTVAGGAGQMPHAHRRVHHIALVRDEGLLRFDRVPDLAFHDEPELGGGGVEVAVGRGAVILRASATDDVDHRTVVLHEVLGTALAGDDVVEIE